MDASMELYAYAQSLADDRRARPMDDIVTTLVTAELDGEKLSDIEFNVFVLLLVGRGQRDDPQPDQRRDARADGEPGPAGAARSATSTACCRPRSTRCCATSARCSTSGAPRPPTPRSAASRSRPATRSRSGTAPRTATKRSSPTPQRFDVGRTPNEHLAFGGRGPHFCLGASLAKMEIRVMFEEILTRLPDMRMAGEPERLRSNLIAGIKHLPVQFTPERRLTRSPATGVVAEQEARSRVASSVLRVGRRPDGRWRSDDRREADVLEHLGSPRRARRTSSSPSAVSIQAVTISWKSPCASSGPRVDREHRLDDRRGEARPRAGDVDDPPERRGDPVRGVAVAVGGSAVRDVGELAAPDEQDLGEQVVLGREPAVDRGEGDPGAVGHRLHHDRVVAAGLGQLGGGGDDQVPPVRLLVGQDGGDQNGPVATRCSLLQWRRSQRSAASPRMRTYSRIRFSREPAAPASGGGPHRCRPGRGGDRR